MRGIRQGVGFATLFLALPMTFQIVPSMGAAPIDCQKNHTRDRTWLPCPAKNCAELYKSGHRISGVYAIDPDGSGAFNVYCDQTTAGGGWVVFQKRVDGSVDFNRTWDDYKHGFGNFTGQFWLGLDKIYRLTTNKTKNILRIGLVKATGKTDHAEYGWFGIGNETAMYKLYIGNVTTNETVFSDSLGPHRDFVFGTWDRDPADCPQRRGGGWWYGNSSDCAVWSNLNGIYPRGKKEIRASIFWGNLDKSPEGSSPTSTELKIRPVDFL
ncbi:angiopoietin-related protein 7-like [Stylophora pistillata]|nr:angiopoietin-related protein 7-like [Stylophora pistillata]